MAVKIGHFISAGLDKIETESQNPDTIRLAQSIRVLATGSRKGKDCPYQPDAQFRHEYSLMPKCPGVVVVVSWTQSLAGREGLEKKMGDLLEIAGGRTRAVIGVRLRKSVSCDLKMFLSLWRFTTLHSSDVLKVAWNRVWDYVQIFPGDERILRLTLGDFVSLDIPAKGFPGADLDTEVPIPLGRVYQDAKYSFGRWSGRTRKISEEDQDEPFNA